MRAKDYFLVQCCGTCKYYKRKAKTILGQEGELIEKIANGCTLVKSYEGVTMPPSCRCINWTVSWPIEEIPHFKNVLESLPELEVERTTFVFLEHGDPPVFIRRPDIYIEKFKVGELIKIKNEGDSLLGRVLSSRTYKVKDNECILELQIVNGCNMV